MNRLICACVFTLHIYSLCYSHLEHKLCSFILLDVPRLCCSAHWLTGRVVSCRRAAPARIVYADFIHAIYAERAKDRKRWSVLGGGLMEPPLTIIHCGAETLLHYVDNLCYRGTRAWEIPTAHTQRYSYTHRSLRAYQTSHTSYGFFIRFKSPAQVHFATMIIIRWAPVPFSFSAPTEFKAYTHIWDDLRRHLIFVSLQLRTFIYESIAGVIEMRCDE